MKKYYLIAVIILSVSAILWLKVVVPAPVVLQTIKPLIFGWEIGPFMIPVEI